MNPLMLGWHLDCIAAEEAGHKVVQEAFGHQTRASLEYTPKGELVGGMVETLDGGDAFERGCGGWGGVIARYLLGYIGGVTDRFPALHAASVRSWAQAALDDFSTDLLSDSDRKIVRRSPDPIRSAEIAFEWLSSDDGGFLLRREFDRLRRDFRKQELGEGESPCAASIS